MKRLTLLLLLAVSSWQWAIADTTKPWTFWYWMYGAVSEEGIKADGGIDIQILGIGSDGHIGFNEPATSLASRTHVQTLMLGTRQDNARLFFNGKLDEVPTRAMTMGTGTVLDSRTAILLAFGKGKAPAIAGAVEGAITHMNQASALQMHRDAKFFIDEDAASMLKHADFYKAVYADSDLKSLEA